ncbi:NeuD/PglB/VioB family sugar acetyltransferase [Microbacterium sp. LRZ72]|uniref:NeuD/PglB/VioB family sugar acetyltransferase n=1 Tax=Microbacterium sp. LRZ72 TaxID=2942481 RepID=UPI0029BC58D6|nr:NeuD/PglB/VioB family sugar acetyltransferase [Microbacterium sp. LRZ72]MDX2377631.1 NeuD/PglB/VioB family sugar acetyltransferase [Microbacterium sp. LRZ72]
MVDELVVVGAGGFGRETLDVIEAINASTNEAVWKVLGVTDDAPSSVSLERLAARGYKYLGPSPDVRASRSATMYVVGVGSPNVKAQIVADFDAAGWEAPVLIHPSASIGSMTALAAGSVVCGGVQLSTNTRLGRHVHLNPGSIVGHDAALADFVSVNPGAVVSGDARIGARVLIGAGAVVLQGLEVGAGAVVGAAACVTRSVRPHQTVVGVPARSVLRGDVA